MRAHDRDPRMGGGQGSGDGGGDVGGGARGGGAGHGADAAGHGDDRAGGPGPGPVGSLWEPRVRMLTVGLVAIITLVAFEALAVITVLPDVADDLDGLSLYGWATSAFFLGTTVGIVIAGTGTDRAGPAPPFVAGLALFSVGLAVAASAPTMPVLVVGRGLQGLGGGAIPAIAFATIGRVYPPALRPRMFAVLSTAWVVPGLGGPALSALIATHLGWRWVFGALLPMVLVAGLVPFRALRAIQGGPGEDARPVPVLAALRVSAGAGLVLAGLSSRSAFGVPLVLLGVAVGVGPLRGLLPAGTLRARRGIPATVAARGLLTYAFFGADTFVPLSITAVRHAPTTTAGVAVSTATIFWTAGSWLQARLADRRPERELIRAGLVLVALGTAGLASVLLPDVVPLAVPIACWGVAGLGMGMAYSPIITLVLAEVPAERQGAASTAVSLCDNLGTAFGAGVSGVAVAASQAASGRPDTGLLITFALTVTVGLFAAAVITRRMPGGAVAPDAAAAAGQHPPP